jgi:putative MFS transporter
MTVVAMTYIGEVFPSHLRGAYQARILMFGLIGIPATAYVARIAVPLGGWGWRLVFVWGALAIFFPLFARRLEESPRWLEHRGKRAEESIGIKGLIRSGAGGRAVLLVCVWFCQTLGFYGFNAWVPTLLAEQGIPIARTLSQSFAISIGVIPGAFLASLIAERWERKYLIAIVAVAVGAFGMFYGLTFTTWTIVTFGFLVAASQQVFAPLLYAYTAECFPTNASNTGAGLSYGIGRLGNAVGPLIVAFLYTTYGYRSVFAYIAACWAVVALLVLAFGPRMNQRTLA